MTEDKEAKLRQRRALEAISIGFLIYMWGGGEIIQEQVTLQAINIKLNNTTLLLWGAWIMFGWFLWRYWQYHRSKGYRNLLSDMKTKFSKKAALEAVVRQKSIRHYREENDIDIAEATLEDFHFTSILRIKARAKILKNKPARKASDTDQLSIMIPRRRLLKGKMLALYKSIKLNTIFAEEIVPYLLAILVIISGLYHLILMALLSFQ